MNNFLEFLFEIDGSAKLTWDTWYKYIASPESWKSTYSENNKNLYIKFDKKDVVLYSPGKKDSIIIQKDNDKDIQVSLESTSRYIFNEERKTFEEVKVEPKSGAVYAKVEYNSTEYYMKISNLAKPHVKMQPSELAESREIEVLKYLFLDQKKSQNNGVLQPEIPEDDPWAKMCERTADALKEFFNKNGMSIDNYVGIHTGASSSTYVTNTTYTEDSNQFKNIITKFIKAIKYKNKDAWNPMDIVLIKTSDIKGVNSDLDEIITDGIKSIKSGDMQTSDLLSEVNSFILDSYKNKKIIPVSLKMNDDNNPKITLFNYDDNADSKDNQNKDTSSFEVDIRGSDVNLLNDVTKNIGKILVKETTSSGEVINYQIDHKYGHGYDNAYSKSNSVEVKVHGSKSRVGKIPANILDNLYKKESIFNKDWFGKPKDDKPVFSAFNISVTPNGSFKVDDITKEKVKTIIDIYTTIIDYKIGNQSKVNSITERKTAKIKIMTGDTQNVTPYEIYNKIYNIQRDMSNAKTEKEKYDAKTNAGSFYVKILGLEFIYFLLGLIKKTGITSNEIARKMIRGGQKFGDMNSFYILVK